MKIATFDDGFCFDDPNLYWGDPSYLLEPGDPGYVSPAPLVNPTPPKGRKMKRRRHYPIQVAKQVLWLENWWHKLGDHAAVLGLTPAQVAASVADARWLLYVLQTWLPAVRGWSQSCTSAAQDAQSGAGAAALALPVFTPPPLLTGVVPVAPGALGRIQALGEAILISPGYVLAIGLDLGLVGTEDAGPDLDTLQPLLPATNTAAGVNLAWSWQGFSAFLDMIDIEVDRDGLGWKPLVSDRTPGYVDSFPQPANQAIWKYRAIFRVGDTQVGQWSAVMSVVVGGKK